MSEKIDAHTLIKNIDNTPIVDVRSPAEFEKGHIPNAINIPLFSNKEREQVGTRYKKSGRENALELGLELVGPKLSDFVKIGKKIAPNKRLMIHCWRGGMRSESMAWLFETSGLIVQVLEGGYNAYRKYIREQFSLTENLIVLSGYTGSGKTDILIQLMDQGEQVIDLEGLANHRGSAFGGIGQNRQPTNEQFENDLAYQWNKLDMTKRIWIEDESITIGHNGVPDTLYRKMREAKVIRVNIPKSERVKRLVKEYAPLDKEELKCAIERIHEKLGGLAAKQAISALDNNDYATTADIALTYYDKAYLKGLQKRNPNAIKEVNFDHDNPAYTASELIKLFASK
ncbi:MAG: tRNA 2-selenouridine(34) synthase MnmH [Bacteroidales bacterium]